MYKKFRTTTILLFLTFAIVNLLFEGSFAFQRIGLGFSSISVSNATAGSPHIVLRLNERFSLRGKIYALGNFEDSSYSPSTVGTDIACYYDFDPILNTKVIPQFGAAYSWSNYWNDLYGYHTSTNIFKSLIGVEWYAYDFLSFNFTWPFLEYTWVYTDGTLSQKILFFMSPLNAGLTFYF